jgi:hypothetical protein
LTIYSTTTDSPSEKMEKSEEHAAVTFAAYNEELVIADTLATNNEEYADATTLAAYNEEFHTNDSPSEEMKKFEEYADATFAAHIEELVTTDTLATNDKGYVDAATRATNNEEVHTDKNIVKRHTNFKFNKNNEEGGLPCPMLQDGCNQDELIQLTLQWRLLMREKGEVRQQLLSCIDALGYKISTSSVTDMMMELGKLAVDETFAVEEIVTMVENMCIIPEETMIIQPDTHRNQLCSGLSKQTLPRLEDPALKQMLAEEDPALK